MTDKQIQVKLNKVWNKRCKLYAEADKLWIEGDRLRTEGSKLWTEAIRATVGNTTLDWQDDGTSCVLGTGQSFKM